MGITQQVGGDLKLVAVTPTVSASPDYSDGDVVGAVMDFAAVSRLQDGGSGYVTGVTILSKVDNTARIDLVLFKSEPTATYTDNSAVAVDATDLARVIGAVKVETWFDLGTPVVGFAECRVPFKVGDGDSLYGVLVARGAINLGTTSDITVEIAVDMN